MGTTVLIMKWMTQTDHSPIALSDRLLLNQSLEMSRSTANEDAIPLAMTLTATKCTPLKASRHRTLDGSEQTVKKVPPAKKVEPGLATSTGHPIFCRQRVQSILL